MWLGDASYTSLPTSVPFVSPYVLPSAEHTLRRFEDTRQAPAYREMIDRGTKVIGVWDDHDYGKNDAGSAFIGKVRQRKMYLDFVGEPSDSERYREEDTPIY